jgi:uncharacterized protein RhaS with RHS repeats
MRYRDLETGTFLTRDPIGYRDGPNVYCYVHCNPITHFDAFGLADGDTLEDYQNKLDRITKEHEAEMASLQEKIDEQQKIMDAEPGVYTQDYMLAHIHKGTHEWNMENKTKSFSERVGKIEQSMAALKASPWDREGKVWLGGRIAVLHDGKPMIRAEIASTGQRTYRVPTPDDIKYQFKRNAKGKLVPCTYADYRARFHGEVKHLDKLANACDAYAVGTGIVVAAPVAIPMWNAAVDYSLSVIGLTAYGSRGAYRYYWSNAPRINHITETVVRDFFDQSGPSASGAGQIAWEWFFDRF